MRRGKQKVRMSNSVTEIGSDNAVRVRKTKRANAGLKKPVEKDPLALPRSPRAKAAKVKTKAARKQSAEPEEYEVEKIVGHKQEGRHLSYRIRWRGWGPQDDTWEEEAALNCPEMLDKYKRTAMSLIADTLSPAAKSSGGKKRGRPSAKTTSSPKKAKGGVAGGRVAKRGRGRPPSGSSTKTGKKRGRKPRADKEWEVEEIVAVRITEAGTEEFLVKWKGYSSDENTWEPLENVGKCDEAIERFRLANGDGTGTNGTDGAAVEDEGRSTEEEVEEIPVHDEESVDN